jgi:hypothetical protein
MSPFQRIGRTDIPYSNDNKKGLTVKVLFTIRQLQPKYEMQRDPGSFFG